MECLISGTLARAAGWVKKYDRTPTVNNSIRWGWGLNVIIRDWKADTLKKICLEVNVGSLLEAGYFLERTQLFRGAETLPPGGSNRDYLFRLPTTDWSLVMGNSNTPQKKSDPPAEEKKGEKKETKKDGEDGVKGSNARRRHLEAPKGESKRSRTSEEGRNSQIDPQGRREEDRIQRCGSEEKDRRGVKRS